MDLLRTALLSLALAWVLALSPAVAVAAEAPKAAEVASSAQAAPPVELPPLPAMGVGAAAAGGLAFVGGAVLVGQATAPVEQLVGGLLLYSGVSALGYGAGLIAFDARRHARVVKVRFPDHSTRPAEWAIGFNAAAPFVLGVGVLAQQTAFLFGDPATVFLIGDALVYGSAGLYAAVVGLSVWQRQLDRRTLTEARAARRSTPDRRTRLVLAPLLGPDRAGLSLSARF